MYAGTIKVRVTSKTKAARDAAHRRCFENRARLRLESGWRFTSPRQFVVEFNGPRLPPRFRESVRASKDDVVEVRMPGEAKYRRL